jgi:tRNA-modifying protein YgfZ
VTDWHSFLVARGALIAGGQVETFGEGPADCDHLLAIDTLSELGHLGALAVTGPHSARFLQGQTTADFAAPAAPGPIAGACCTPQGRVFAHFVALPTATGYLLIMPRSLIAPACATLAPYAALARVELADASEHWRLLGLAGPAAAATLAALGLHPDGPAPDGTRTLAHEPGRQLLAVPSAAAEARWASLETLARPVGLPLWHLADIRAGIATLEPATRAAFVPQMLNFQLRGMLSFSKGCYTGQEVVARSQYRGSLKRHLHRLAIGGAAPPSPGAAIQVPETAQAVGTLLRAVRCGADRCEALAVLLDGSERHPALDFGTGPRPVEFLSLPVAAEPG